MIGKDNSPKRVSAGKRMTTIKDVALAARVSPTTVSFVLNGQGNISPEVRQRVQEAAARLRYRPNSQARAIRTGETRTIGFVIPDLRNPFFPELVEVVGRAAQGNGYAMLIGYANSLEHERESFAELVSRGVDGICWCPSSQVDTPGELGLHKPIVTLDRRGGDYDLVTSNIDQGAQLIATEVRRCGFQTVGLVNGPRDIPAARGRAASFAKALRGSAKIEWQVENPFSIEVAQQNVEWIRAHPVDAIICANDTIAIGILRALKDAKIAVPQDMSVIGFDDIPWSSLVEPPLTTVRQDLPEMAARAVDLLIARIGNPIREICRIELDVQWKGRGTTTPNRSTH
jgi:LacI family transcriptional regulator